VVSPERTVRAAGGVVWRRRGDRVEVLVVHRPRYDDWSLPKGKRDGGESDRQTARREVLEETGLTCVLGPELATSTYVDGRGRPKVVRYWAMTVEDGQFVANDEVDEVRWLDADQVIEALTYGRDHPVVASFLALDLP